MTTTIKLTVPKSNKKMIAALFCALLTLVLLAAASMLLPQTASAAEDKIVVNAQTADVDEADTWGNIFIRIYDETGLVLEKSMFGNGINRDENRTRAFPGYTLGTIEKIELYVSSNNNWCVSWLNINGVQFEARNCWVSNRWDVVLYPSDDAREYEITTDTEDEFEGGTSGNCYVKFVGDSAETRWMIMDKNVYTDQARGNSDTYILRDIDVGTVRQIVLYNDSSHDEWCLARVHFQGVTYHCFGKGLEDGDEFTINVDYSGATEINAASVFSEISTGTWFAIIGGGLVFAAGIIFAVVRKKKQDA